MGRLSSVLRAIGLGALVENPIRPDFGAEFGGDYPRTPPYDPENAMEAGAAFSWLYASANLRAARLSGLPILVYRQRHGERELLDDHWLYGLLDQPNSYQVGEQLRRDIYVDWLLSGACYLPIYGVFGARVDPIALVRWHPERVSIVPSRSGIFGFTYNSGSGQVTLAADRVLFCRASSFRDDPAGFHAGVGVVEPLHRELEAEHQAILRAGETARRGRADVLITPKAGGFWSSPQRTEIKERYEAMMRAGGGCLVGSSEADITPLSFSPRDMEFQKLREANRQAILAVTRTPPVGVGLETANFATAEMQDEQLWVSLQDDARLFDAACWTRLLRLAGEADTVAETDFGGVRALQRWRSSAVTRAVQLILAGIPEEVALESEGLGDVAAALRAAGVQRQDAAAPTSLPPADQEAGWAPAVDLGTMFSGCKGMGTDEQRAERWQHLRKTLQKPAERILAQAAARVLLAQAARLAGKVRTLLAKNYSVDALIGQLWDQTAEQLAMQEGLEEEALRVVRRAFLQAAEEMSLGQGRVDWDPEAAYQLAREELGARVVNMSATTQQALIQVLDRGIQEGQSVAELAAAIQDSAAFGPGRALAIARTESARALSIGGEGAMKRAQASGVSLKKGWLSSRGEGTRSEHWALDGQVVEVGQKFTIPASGNGHVSRPKYIGLQADGPGGFGTAAMDVNCTCSIIPVLDEES